MKPGYHEIYSRYRDNITRGVLKPGDKIGRASCRERVSSPV